MTVDHRCRLGSLDGASAIARHPFFNGIDWAAVEQKRLMPPFRYNPVGVIVLSCLKLWLQAKPELMINQTSGPPESYHPNSTYPFSIGVVVFFGWASVHSLGGPKRKEVEHFVCLD